MRPSMLLLHDLLVKISKHPWKLQKCISLLRLGGCGLLAILLLSGRGAGMKGDSVLNPVRS